MSAPPGANPSQWTNVKVEWYCKVTDWQIDHSAALARRLGSTLCRLRSDVHGTTRDRKSDTGEVYYRPDEFGDHYTAEIKIDKTGRWTTFHLYTTEVTNAQGHKVTIKNPKVEVNPRKWPGKGSYVEKKKMRLVGQKTVRVY
ncbi:hypothetical protein LTR24_010484 [Lithohypha guttulata]|uniref:Uncharacterized protein n=1 Tax=Lithohypha guttulata TaxID=1690604 RepID=A0ABR0JU10_9EURO|nr:hypothetical protein LTR24_010484 [Lithohypha guttulata]